MIMSHESCCACVREVPYCDVNVHGHHNLNQYSPVQDVNA